MRPLPLILALAGTLAAQNGTIHGTVKDTLGAPVGGMSVRATPAGPGGAMMVSVSVDTDEAGSYVFTDTAPGTYSVQAERTPSPREVKVEAGADVTVDFVIPATGSISGRVLDDNKQPVADVSVYLFTPEISGRVLHQLAIGPKVTGADGSYTFDTGLQVNRRYYVLADRPPSDDLANAAGGDLPDREPIEVPTYYPSATRMDAAGAVVLRAGEHARADITMAKAPFYCVEGKIQSSATAGPVAFAILETPPAGIRQARLRTISGADGKYHLCGLPAGSYRLAADAGFTEFTIAGSDMRQVDLSLDMAYPRLQIDWEGPAPTPDLPKLGPQEQQTLRQIAGMLGLGESDDAVQAAAARLLHMDPNDMQMRAIFSRPAGDRDLNPGINGLLDALQPHNINVTAGLIGLDGRLATTRWDSVPAGDYMVDIQSPAGSYAKEVTFNGTKVTDGLLTLTPGTSGTLHVLIARGTALLNLSVADSEGKPVADASVIVAPESVTSAVSLVRLARRGQTDKTGSAVLDHFPPGKYRVLATTQTIRWDVPDDLEKVLAGLLQGKEIELNAKAAVQIALAPVLIY